MLTGIKSNAANGPGANPEVIIMFEKMALLITPNLALSLTIPSMVAVQISFSSLVRTFVGSTRKYVKVSPFSRGSLITSRLSKTALVSPSLSDALASARAVAIAPLRWRFCMRLVSSSPLSKIGEPGCVTI